MFVTATHFHPSLTFPDTHECTLKGETLVRLVAVLPAIISLGCMWLTVTNALAYQGTKLITDVKCLIVQAPAVVASVILGSKI